MLNTYFFADADFLELLAFWDSSRQGRPLPDWHGDLGAMPPGLLTNLIISDRRGEATYRYVGAECVRRFGRDPTGERAYGNVLLGAHARYLQSLSSQTLDRRAPIFSTAVYRPDADEDDMLMTGRLHTPFTYQGSAAPQMIVALQLFRGSESDLRRIGPSGMVHEIRRDLIADAGALTARLGAARRAYQIQRHTGQRTLAQDVDTLVGELTGRALISLPCHEEPDAAPASA